MKNEKKTFILGEPLTKVNQTTKYHYWENYLQLLNKNEEEHTKRQ